MSLATAPVARDLRRVRARITAATTVVLVAILVGAGWVLVRRFEHEVVDQVDAQLLDASDYVARIGASDQRFPPVDDAFDLVQVVDERGRVVFSSSGLRSDAVLWTPGGQERHPSTIRTSRDGDLRVSAVRFRDRWVVFASSLGPVTDDVRTLREAMLVGLLPVTLLLAAVVWLVVGRTLRPVAAAVEREEQLVADVSHELRSPLAGLRVLLETEPVERQEVELSRIEALTTLGRLESITDQLLVLARQGQPRSGTSGNPVDLDEIVVDQVRALTPRSSVPIDTRGVGAGQVVGRDDDLRSLVANLLSNAVRHARGAVAVAVAERDGTVELVVDDDGPGIRVEDRARVFQRFTRLDDARSRDTGGAGLGLAIVLAVAQSHHGTVTLHDAPLGGARVAVHLPASVPHPTEPPLTT